MDQIETVFKVVPPFEKIKDGFGHIGVLLRDKEEDRLQCHICGRWFSHLGTHVANAHELKSIEYRYKFGLPAKFPLCGRSISRRRSQVADEHELAKKNLAKTRNYKKMTRCKAYRRGRAWARSSPAFQNKIGGCKDQIERRYITVCDQVGKEANVKEVRECDPPLVSLIVRRFGGFNKFKKEIGLKENRAWGEAQWDEVKIVSALRKFVSKYEKIPSSHDTDGLSFKGFPSANAVRRVFGSWNRALISAGFDRELA